MSDKGPWSIYKEGGMTRQFMQIASEDFTHDVILTIYGDFDDQSRKQYAEWLISVLNKAGAELKVSK